MTLTLTQVHTMLDELAQCNGYWANELTQLGIATALGGELDDEDVEDVTAVLFEDCYGDLELAAVAECLEAREADLEVVTFGELQAACDRFGWDLNAAVATQAELLTVA